MDRPLRIVGARTHNLRDVTLEVPSNRITVFTGPSGSGKSSLVFDTIAAESQRQLHETFPAFVRNRLPQYGRPEVDEIVNLTVAIVVDQSALGTNSRSTVGTATEIYGLLRLLFSRAGSPSVGSTPYLSFNDARGMCPRCEGLGMVRDVDVDRLIDPAESLNSGAILFPTYRPGTWRWKRYALSGLFDVDKPVGEYSEQEWELFVHVDSVKLDRPPQGFPKSGVYEGLLARFRRNYLNVDRDSLPPVVRQALAEVLTEASCPECEGTRLNAAARACRVGGVSITEVARWEMDRLGRWAEQLELPQLATVRAALVERTRAVLDVGLGYLSLDRATPTLSGGEAQRIKLVKHLGSSLTRLTYILDEPSSGLHPADIDRVLGLVRDIRDKGSTVLMVEHDRDVITAADHVVDIGPGSGSNGGEVVFTGNVKGLSTADTPTGRALRLPLTTPLSIRTPRGTIARDGLRSHNLHDVAVSIPLGVLTAVTGVAGSGKSTLVAAALRDAPCPVTIVDQSAIPRAPRSTPLTHLGIGDTVRRLFAAGTGVPVSMFSANSDGGCQTCRGLGYVELDLAYMDSVRSECDACGGTRFRPEALAARLDGASIADVLAMTIGEAAGFFHAEPKVRDALVGAVGVGLGYLPLGQSLATLSGGERQRLKLCDAFDDTEALLVLDEPTTGLHPLDIAGLLNCFTRFVDAGGTMVVIEHDAQVILAADWVIDVGPGAGRHGGRVVFAGTPADLVSSDTTTAKYLRRSRHLADEARAAGGRP